LLICPIKEVCTTVSGIIFWWLSSSGRWHRVALIRTDVSEDRNASIFRVHECEQVTERSCKLLYRHRLVGATRCHLPEDDNHHSHRRGNLKSYKLFFCSWLFTLNSSCDEPELSWIIYPVLNFADKIMSSLIVTRATKRKSDERSATSLPSSLQDSYNHEFFP
jgi:hypothetical protein